MGSSSITYFQNTFWAASTDPVSGIVFTLYTATIDFLIIKMHAMEENKRGGSPGQSNQDQSRQKQDQRDQQQGRRGMDQDMNQSISDDDSGTMNPERDRNRQGNQDRSQSSDMERGGVL